MCSNRDGPEPAGQGGVQEGLPGHEQERAVESGCRPGQEGGVRSI